MLEVERIDEEKLAKRKILEGDLGEVERVTVGN
jgi:hypothetical protein